MDSIRHFNDLPKLTFKRLSCNTVLTLDAHCHAALTVSTIIPLLNLSKIARMISIRRMRRWNGRTPAENVNQCKIASSREDMGKLIDDRELDGLAKEEA
eukprot:6204015-Pleurochrysis_carterae.AAC.2